MKEQERRQNAETNFQKAVANLETALGQNDSSDKLQKLAAAIRKLNRDVPEELERRCLDLIEELARIEGVAGVHLMAPANESDIAPVIAEARKRLPPERQSALSSFAPKVGTEDIASPNPIPAARHNKRPFTAKQGQYLAFIHLYTRLHRRPPAETDMQEYFRVSPPSVHQMVVTLERAGLIKRQPRTARSIEVLVDSADLPELLDPSSVGDANFQGA